MLCGSESKDSYHLLCKPSYHNRPPTLRLLNEVFGPFCDSRGIEIFPRPSKTIRLPFGKLQSCIDPGYAGYTDWQNRLYWFEKLDDYDLSTVPEHQRLLDLDIPQKSVPAHREGELLFEHGLQRPHTRHDAQWKVILYLWRRNVEIDASIEIVNQWIRQKHNGFSEDVRSNPRVVRQEIKRQASHIFSMYTLPDDTHNYYHGWLTKQDVVDVVHHCDGSLPRIRFLFQLVKYCYPRRYRGRINVHSDKLKEWASFQTYLKRVGELEAAGIVKRHDY